MSGPVSVKKPPPTDRRAALAKSELLRGVAPAELDAVAAKVIWRVYEKGREVIEQEGGSTDVYLIGSGRVRITIYAASGREVAFPELAEGTRLSDRSAVDRRSPSPPGIAP